MSMYIHLFTVAIPVNYISEFRELLEAATYVYIAATIHPGGRSFIRNQRTCHAVVTVTHSSRGMITGKQKS